MTQNVLRDLNAGVLTPDEAFWEFLIENVRHIKSGVLTTHSGKIAYTHIASGGIQISGTYADSFQKFIDENNLIAKSSAEALGPIVDEILAKNAKIVADFKSGKQQAIGALIGPVMKQVTGANPQAVRELLIAKIAALP